jgi:hypothetical protein
MSVQNLFAVTASALTVSDSRFVHRMEASLLGFRHIVKTKAAGMKPATL